MDPTAPKDNDQNNPQSGEDQQDNPIQPGQFVVSGELQAQPQTSSTPLPVDPQPSQPLGNAPQLDPNPKPLTDDLGKNLEETVAQATGAATIASPQNQPPQSSPLDQLSSQPPESAPAPASLQPDPTPFTPPQDSAAPPLPGPSVAAPIPGPQPQPQQQDLDSGSKIGKAIPIIVGIIALIAIVAAVAWFFILNRQSKEPTTTTEQSPVEAPTSPSPVSKSGFGEIEESPSPEASPEASPETVNPPTETINPPLY